MVDPVPDGTVLMTSVFRYLTARLGELHRGYHLGAFAGPPGIGKTKAITSFQAQNARSVVVVCPRHPDARPTVVMQTMLEAIRAQTRMGASYPDNARALSISLDRAVSDWAWRVAKVAGDRTPITVIFDEAQNLTSKSIEALRWNDGSPQAQPVGMAFIGNHQFRLEGDGKSASFLSAAVVSRASYIKPFSYHNVTDEDLALFSSSLGISEPSALAQIARHCRLHPHARDLRHLGRDLGRVVGRAGDAPVTGDMIAQAFAL